MAEQPVKDIVTNLTSVDVTVMMQDSHCDSLSTTRTYPRSGTVAVLSTETTQIGLVDGIPLVKVDYISLSELPPEEPNHYYIVSMPVGLMHKTGRHDLIGPNTDAAIRESTTNRILGVPNFVQY
jgi:hypothetical protein